jgi:acetyltransferase-like isoleucine patch superfamily enzyme
VVFIGKTAYNPAGVNRMCSLRVEEKGRLKIGDHVGFSGVSIVATESIEIGEYCMVGANVSIWDTDFHPLEWVLRRQNSCANTRHKGIHIGNDVFLGAGSIILKGVTIGDRAIIGAGSVVRGDIPADEVWAGNPAIFIRKLGDETTR